MDGNPNLSKAISAMSEEQLAELGVSGDSSPDLSFSEYDNAVKLMKDDLDSLKVEQRELRMQVLDIVNENERLRNELKKYMEQPTTNRFNAAQESEDRNPFDKSLLEMWHIALDEIEHLKMLLEAKKTWTEFETPDQQMEQVRSEYTRAVDVLSKELSQTRTELRNLKNDMLSKTGQVEECEKIIQVHAETLKEKEELINDLSSRENDMTAKVISLEVYLKDSREILEKKKKEIAELNMKFEETILTNEELKKQNSMLKSQKQAIQKEAKENLLTTEKAVLDKEEAVYKEQLALKEMQSLKFSIDQVVEQSTSKYKLEVRNTKKQYEEKVQSFEEELRSLELDRNEKQSLYDMAIREKQALKSELQALYEANAGGVTVANSVFEDVCKNLTKTEHERDALQLENQTLLTSLKETQLSKEQQLQHLQEETKRVKQRYKRLQEDFNQILSDRMQLADQTEQYRKKCFDLEKELAYIKNRHQNDLYLLEQKLQQKQHSHQHHLLVTEEIHKKATTGLQNLLDAQHRINNKWKSEMQELTAKFETKMRDMIEDNMRLLHQNEELSWALQQKKNHIER